jgi:hypothetical protein
MEDNRKITWSEFEDEIQKRSNLKDTSFRLTGPWKKFLRSQDGYQIYVVDGEWINNNISILYGHGGHGCVHEFIPMDEIWVSKCHMNCDCVNSYPGKPMSEKFMDSTILHEIKENIEMRKGENFWIAHNKALDEERKAGLISTPYTELK